MMSSLWIFLLTKLSVSDTVLFKCDALIRFSATDALKGEGLQEGVDWLQGTICAERSLVDNKAHATFCLSLTHLC